MKYDAFISYRHAELDTQIAKTVHKKLETFTVPYSVRKKSGKKKISRVFRDQDELPIGSDLTNNIEQALADSEYLIVICTPRTPGSEWVLKEINTFIALHDRSHVLAVLAEGEPNEAFPAPLLVDENGRSVEPLAADVRGKTKREINKLLKTEIMRLAAPLLNCSYDDLRQRHRERRLKRNFGIFAGLAVVVAGLGVAFGFYNANKTRQINENYQKMLENQSKFLAKTSLEQLAEGDNRTAILLALEALPSDTSDRPLVSQAQYALNKALNCYANGNSFEIDAALQMNARVHSDCKPFINSDATYISAFDISSTTYVWSTDDYSKVCEIEPTFTPNSTYVDSIKATEIYDDVLYIIREHSVSAYSIDGEIKWSYNLPKEAYYYGHCISSNNSVMAYVSSSQVLTLDLNTGNTIFSNAYENSFTFGTPLFNEDGSNLYLKHRNDQSIDSIDLSTGNITSYALPVSYVKEFCLLGSDYIYAIGADNDDIDSSNTNFYACCINAHNGASIWSHPLDVKGDVMSTSKTTIKACSYTDTNNEIISNTVISLYDRIYCFDSITGNLKSSATNTDDVATLLVSASSDYAFMCQRSGTITPIDLSTGTILYQNIIIEAPVNFSHVSGSHGIYVSKSFYDSRITVMRYTRSEFCEDVRTYDQRIKQITTSDDEAYYCADYFDNKTFSFYDTDTDQLVYEYVIPSDLDSRIYDSFFIGNNTYCIVLQNASCIYIDLKANTSEVVEFNDDYISNLSLSANHQYAFYRSEKSDIVVDLRDRKVVYSEESPTSAPLYGCSAASNTGYTISTITVDGLLWITSLKSGDTKSYQIFTPGESAEADSIEFGNTDKFLAIHKKNGQLLVIDISSGNIIYETQTHTSKSPFAFSKDDTKFCYQSDNYFYHVYNLELQKDIYVSNEQTAAFNSIVWNEDGSLTIRAGYSLIILTQDYELVAEIPDGLAYLTNHNEILSFNQTAKSLYRFKYLGLADLIEYAHKRIHNDALSASERTRFNLD